MEDDLDHHQGGGIWRPTGSISITKEPSKWRILLTAFWEKMAQLPKPKFARKFAEPAFRREAFLPQTGPPSGCLAPLHATLFFLRAKTQRRKGIALISSPPRRIGPPSGGFAAWRLCETNYFFSRSLPIGRQAAKELPYRPPR